MRRMPEMTSASLSSSARPSLTSSSELTFARSTPPLRAASNASPERSTTTRPPFVRMSLASRSKVSAGSSSSSQVRPREHADVRGDARGQRQRAQLVELVAAEGAALPAPQLLALAVAAVVDVGRARLLARHRPGLQRLALEEVREHVPGLTAERRAQRHLGAEDGGHAATQKPWPPRVRVQLLVLRRTLDGHGQHDRGGEHADRRHAARAFPAARAANRPCLRPHASSASIAAPARSTSSSRPGRPITCSDSGRPASSTPQGSASAAAQAVEGLGERVQAPRLIGPVDRHGRADRRTAQSMMSHAQPTWRSASLANALEPRERVQVLDRPGLTCAGAVVVPDIAS